MKRPTPLPIAEGFDVDGDDDSRSGFTETDYLAVQFSDKERSSCDGADVTAWSSIE
jgi:hypothetical protein